MKTLQNWGLSTSRWALVAMLVALPLSKALFHVALLLMVLGWVISGDYRQKLQAMLQSPTARAAVLLVAALLASAVYSSASHEDMRHAAGIYLRLLIVPVVVSIIRDDEWLRRCWMAWMAGMTILLLHVYANVWVEIPWARSAAEQVGNRGVFNAHMVQSVSLAFFVAVLLHRSTQAPTPAARWMMLMLAGAAALSITHLSESRTGYLALLLVLTIQAILIVPRRWLLPTLLGLAICFTLIAFLTPSISERVIRAYQEVAAYSQVADYSSVGSRLYMWKVSVELVLQAPWFGHGLGSYAHLAQRAFSDATLCSTGCQHPHNEYLFTAVQMGVVGLLLLLNFLIKPLQTWRQLGRPDAIAPVFVGLLVLTAIPDGPIWFRGFAFFFIPVMGLLAADLQNQASRRRAYGSLNDDVEQAPAIQTPTAEGKTP